MALFLKLRGREGRCSTPRPTGGSRDATRDFSTHVCGTLSRRNASQACTLLHFGHCKPSIAEGWASAECMDPVGDFGHFGGFELHFTCLVVSFGSSRWFCFWLLGFCHFDGFDLFVLGPLGVAYLVGPLNR